MRTEKPRYHTSSCRLRDIDKHQASQPDYRWRSSIQLNFIKKWKEWSKTESGCDLQKKQITNGDLKRTTLEISFLWSHEITRYICTFYFFVGCISFQLHIHKMIIFTHLFLSFFVCECRFISRVSRLFTHTKAKLNVWTKISWWDQLSRCGPVLFLRNPRTWEIFAPPLRPRLMYNVNSTRRLMQSFTCKVLWKCHH